MIYISFSRVMFVVAVTMLATVIAFFALRGAVVTYDADVKILVDQPQIMGSPAGGANLNKILLLVPTYIEMVYSYSVTEKVASELSNSTTTQEVQESLSAKQIEKTQIMVVSARHDDSEKAKAIATAGSQALIDMIQSQQSEAKVKPEERFIFSILEPANLARANVPNRARTVFLAAVTALIVSVGAVIVFDSARES